MKLQINYLAKSVSLNQANKKKSMKISDTVLKNIFSLYNLKLPLCCNRSQPTKD
jgi:hypothetical protein